LRASLGIRIGSLKLKLAPTRDDRGAQRQRPAKTLGRANGLVGRLAVGEKNLGKT